jgi:hypothetical protein
MKTKPGAAMPARRRINEGFVVNAVPRRCHQPASDRGDAYTVAIGHQDGDNFVIDLADGVLGKYDPYVVTERFVALLKTYRINTVTGDNFASQWVAQYWRKCGFEYRTSPWDRSELYIDVMALFSGRRVRLPDHPRMLPELRLLERTPGTRGNDVVNHPRGGHDDFVNAVCGVLCMMKNHAAAEEKVPTGVVIIHGDGTETTSASPPSHDRLEHLRRNTYRRDVMPPDEPGVAYMKAHGIDGMTWTSFRASRSAVLTSRAEGCGDEQTTNKATHADRSC